MLHARVVNTDFHRSNQGAYMNASAEMSESGYTVIGDRNRMPLYPLLQSPFHSPGMDPARFFAIGKRNNIVLSVILLAVLMALFGARLETHARVNLFLVTAFDVYLFKAGYFQCELLFYTLAFAAFLLMGRMLEAPAWGWGVLAGVTLGLTHLTKASAPVGLALFLACGLAGVALAWARGNGDAKAGATMGRARPTGRALIAGMAIVTGAFLVTVYPYISTSKRVFGSWFYNVNSTYYMWYDSWDEAVAGTRAYGDRVGPVTLPADQIPGPARYFREHTIGQAAARVLRGSVRVIRGGARSYGYFKHLALCGIAGLWLAWRFAPDSLAPLRRRPLAAAFFVSYIAIHFALFAWYTPVASGNRFSLSIFLPFMFGLLWYVQEAGRPRIRLGPWNPTAAGALNVAMSALVAVDIVLALTHRIVHMHGGS